MYIVVVGAGLEGVGLARIAVEAGHDVVLVEPDAAAARRAAELVDVRVLEASITDAGIVEESGLAGADAVFAVTGDDAANLMSAFLAREAGVARIVSVVNQQEHDRLFRHLDVETLVDPERIVAENLFARISETTHADVLRLPEGAQAHHVTLGEDSSLVGRTLAECDEDGRIPSESIIVTLRRDDGLVVPDGETRFRPGDRAWIVSGRALSDDELAALRGGT